MAWPQVVAEVDRFELCFGGRNSYCIRFGDWGKRKESRMIPGFQAGIAWWLVMLLTELGGQERSWWKLCFGKFCFDYVKFKKPVRYPSGNFEWVVSYNSLNRAWKRDLAENVYILRVKKKYGEIVA